MMICALLYGPRYTMEGIRILDFGSQFTLSSTLLSHKPSFYLYDKSEEEGKNCLESVFFPPIPSGGGTEIVNTDIFTTLVNIPPCFPTPSPDSGMPLPCPQKVGREGPQWVRFRTSP